MSELNEEGQRVVQNLATQHGFSAGAVRHMLEALNRGQSSQAQFNHPEFGGMGQWSKGGMTMIGDMFNNSLKARVDGLCADLSRSMGAGSLFIMALPQKNGSWSYTSAQSGSGWPAVLGVPASQGAQNDLRYAYFPQACRLAISHGGAVTVYDTGNHQISGFGQAQSGGQSLRFTSQFGQVAVDSLPVVDMGAEPDRAESPSAPVVTAPVPATAASATGELTDEQIFARLETLADFRDRGIISADDFDAKKKDLLARL